MAEQKKKSWRIEVPAPGFNWKFGPFDLDFRESVATTENQDAMLWANDRGYEVTDTATGKIANELPRNKEAREQAAAEAEAAKKTAAGKK